MMNVLSEMTGGRANVGFTPTDIRNVVINIRCDTIEDHDTRAAVGYLTEIRQNPSRVFFVLSLIARMKILLGVLCGQIIDLL